MLMLCVVYFFGKYDLNFAGMMWVMCIYTHVVFFGGGEGSGIFV